MNKLNEEFIVLKRSWEFVMKGLDWEISDEGYWRYWQLILKLLILLMFLLPVVIILFYNYILVVDGNSENAIDLLSFLLLLLL